jgi:hypothetical protein
MLWKRQRENEKREWAGPSTRVVAGLLDDDPMRVLWGLPSL